jgi:two-component system osmolarity sensor histidine kinase EnvZ
MTLLPRSLLWRTVLLIALLMVAGQLAWLQLFRITERDPMVRRVAVQVVSMINLTRSALIAAHPDKRLALLLSLSQEEGIQIYPADPDEKIETLSEDRPFLKLLANELRNRLGPDTRLSERVNEIPGIWVSFEIDEQQFWLRIPRERVERDDEWRWISWGLVVLALSLISAFLVITRINRPLRELTGAAAAIGRGQTPAPVEESGPTEIETLARAFNQMANDLQRTDADRALLLAGVSHDLRTPLSRIRLGVEMLGEHNDSDSTLKSGMVQDIEDIDAVVGQFLDFARVTEEPHTATETDLNELVNSVLERYQRQGKAVTARLGKLALLPLKTLAMQRLLTNLIDNALRHGGPAVEIETAQEKNTLRLSVLDRGPGIPAAEAERMLQPFTRLDAARSTSGSGLGLAIVDRIAKMHGGSVQLLARAGGGLEARVELPVKK